MKQWKNALVAILAALMLCSLPLAALAEAVAVEEPLDIQRAVEGAEADMALLTEGAEIAQPEANGPDGVIAQANASSSDFEIENGELVAYHGNGGDVVIPDGVTRIGVLAFEMYMSLKSVTIPEGVTSIGDLAFAECEYLTKVTIPSTVTTIGDGAFELCYSLPSVTIPEGVTSIGASAFFGCERLTKATLPRSVTSIGEYAFGQYDFVNPSELIDVTIYGYTGSYAQTYANENKIPFVPLDEDEPVSLAKAKITVGAQVYTGKAIQPAVKVVLKKKTLKKGRDYSVSYKNNTAVGTATVTVKGKGDYTGVAKATFKINPKAVTGLKLAAGAKQLTASWKKVDGVTGYQLQYGLKKGFASAKKATVSKAATVKKPLKDLKSGKTYYVRIRSYKTKGGKSYYSAWSAAKKIKVK